MKKEILNILNNSTVDIKSRYALIKKNTIFLEYIKEATSQYNPKSFPEMIWLFKGNTPACEKMKFIDGNVGYRFCGRATSCICARKNHSKKLSDSKKNRTKLEIQKENEKRKTTCLEKYGVEYNSQSNNVKKKKEKTFIKKYNKKTSLLDNNVKMKIKKSLLERYGVDNPMKSACIKEKAQKTNLEKYGSICSAQSIKLKEQIHKTMIERYGSIHALQNDEILQKRITTSIDRYGTEHAMHVDEFKQKQKRTIMEKYHSNETLTVFFNDQLFKDTFNQMGIYGIHNDFGLSIPLIKQRCKELDLIFDIGLNNPESFIYEILLEYFNAEEISIRNRKEIAPLELDFYIPSIKLAIEVCGLYWHSEIRDKDRIYHLNKLKECNNNDVRLITIFEDEIKYKSNIVKDRITHILQKSKKTCFARQTNIKEISYIDYAAFLNNFHIQGDVKSTKVRIGAYYNDELVGVMGFSNLRKSLGNSYKKGNYELIRFATNGNVPGLGSKLFKYFVKNYTPIKVISYCDLRWGTGNFYKTLGFNLEKITEPNYWYTKDFQIRENRFKFRKSELIKEGFEPTKTEKKIMEDRGYVRIWDCGHQKWIWNE